MFNRQVQTTRWLLDPRELKCSSRQTETIVVGGGIAGLTASIAAAEQGRKVYLVTKDSLEESNSFYAQGGVAAVLHATDSFDLHFQDTIRAGDGLCDEEVVRIVVTEGPPAIARLVEYGGDFDREKGELALSREGGHSAPRVVHTRDSTGMEIQRVLIDRVRSLKNVSVHERCFVLDILRTGNRCTGVLAWSREEGYLAIHAGATILTSGGAGQVYRESTNPEVATGDGLAIAFRGGAVVRDMEFFQFHPTVLYLAGAPRILISETARGEGGILRDGSGCRFMPDYHSSAELAPRDIVSRAILNQMEKTRDAHIFLDLTHLDARFLKQRFPKIHEVCLRYAIDITRDFIPVRPAAHYAIGGVATDSEGRTSLPGFFACGEVAASGLHGANRLGSNSLLEGLVFGRRAGLAASVEIAGKDRVKWDPAGEEGSAREGGGYRVDIWDLRHSLRAVMWRSVGIERDGEGLSDAREKMETWARIVAGAVLEGPSAWELGNMLTLSRLVTDAALARTESRGVHFRKDFPLRDDNSWRQPVRFSRVPFEDQ
jgi:L-aspartate oxidase